ncbi:Uncharacterised protein [uncultured archaeon]|nr:Uncharacterised protein [uncultured archaeon]
MRKECETFSKFLRGDAAGIRVGIDVDGTAAMTNHAIISAYNELKGTTFTVNDYNNWDVLESKVRMPHDVYYELYNKLWLKEPHRIAPAANPELMARLMGAFDVSASTCRPEEHRAPLSAWFEKNYGFVPKIDIVRSSSEKLQKGYDVIFEDAPHFIEEHSKVKSAQKPLVFLITNPWNQDCKVPERVIRKENLDAAITSLLRMQEQLSPQKVAR